MRQSTMPERDDAIEALQRANAELERQIEAVRRIAVRLSTATELEELVREALHTSLELAESEAGSILLHRPDTGKLVFAHVVGEKAKELTGLELAPGQGLAGAVFHSGETLVSQAASSERAHLRELGESIGYVTRNMVTAPLMSPGGKPLGVMQVLNKRGGPFDDHDVKLIETIAAQIAVAITTVRLHQEARLATLMRFIGDISHDVKNMVTPAMIGAETLQMVAGDCFQKFDKCLGRQPRAPEETAELVEVLARLRKAYPEIATMIRESSDAVQQRMAEIAGAVKGVVSEPRFEPTDIASIARRAAAMLASQAQRKGVTLNLELVSELPLAMVDGRQVFNAIYNLLLNATDACRDKDAVTLRCAAEPHGEFPRGNCLLIECTDTGPGMPDNVKARLFTDEAVSTKPGGTGLGTRIIKNVVDAHRGVLELHSALGMGTTISCRLPLTR